MPSSNLPKRILRSPAGLAFMNWFIACYLRVIEKTVSWTKDYDPEAERLIEGAQPFIAAFWHGRMVMMSSAWTADPRQMHLLISLHRDGLMIAGAIERLGFRVIEGSSGRSGMQAFRDMARVLRAQQTVSITPDGPRGPRMRLKPGALKAAQLSGVPIVPITGSARRCWTLGSWDKFMIPKPFTKGVLLAGKPVFVPKKLSGEELEALRLSLEEEMIRLSQEADRRVGREPVQPAPNAG